MVELGFKLMFLITTSCLLITMGTIKQGHACKTINTVPDAE